MDKNSINLEIEAYRVISKEVRRFNRTSNDAELGNYVKGVVDLESQLYDRINEICEPVKESEDTEE